MNIFKSQEQIITEIHNEFDTAQDRLLCQAEKMLAELNITTETSLFAKADRLKKAGFSGVPIVKYVDKKQPVIIKTQTEAELIQYYKQNYPFLKFLTEPEFDRICKKYGLMYAPVNHYKKDVPEKNLQDIEQGQSLRKSDMPENKLSCVLKFHSAWDILPSSRWGTINSVRKYGVPKVLNGFNFRDRWDADRYIKNTYGCPIEYITESISNYEEDRSGLFIAAPKSHFDLNGLSKNGLGFFSVAITKIIEPKDPIVFRYVKGGMQILTKWGLEAEEPELFVDKLN